MTHIHEYQLRRLVNGLLKDSTKLKQHLAETREQCKQIQDVMIAIRENRFTAKNHVLPRCPHGRDKAANDA
ncbi:hypothetical protein [Bermanella sp. R86510]|uniref:hypothetical protein n=1 Tax=unclassified Bermanella TaxID=2627862 RepID=UPI0037CB6145